MVKSETPPERCLSFFKVYLPQHSSKKLKFPPEFLSELNGEVPNKPILRSPLGRLWSVELVTVNDEMFFEKGWEQFVRDNALELGEFIVFQYNGKYVFDFEIYGRTACEKHMTGPFVNNFKKICRVKEEFETEKQEDEGHKKKRKRKSLDKKKLRGNGKYDSGAVKVEGNAFDAESSTRVKPKKRNREVPMTRGTGLRSIKREVKACTNGRSKEDESAANIADNGQPAAPKRSQTTEERTKIHGAKMQEPKNSCIEFTLKPSYLKGPLHLPVEFSAKCLRGVEGLINLRVSDGREWRVRCLSKMGMARLSKGWRAFASDNGLKAGDVCVLERIEARDVTLMISIIRKF